MRPKRSRLSEVARERVFAVAATKSKQNTDAPSGAASRAVAAAMPVEPPMRSTLFCNRPGTIESSADSHLVFPKPDIPPHWTSAAIMRFKKCFVIKHRSASTGARAWIRNPRRECS